MQNEIAALSKIQSDISSYQKQQDAVERTRQKLGVLQQQYDNIQKRRFRRLELSAPIWRTSSWPSSYRSTKRLLRWTTRLKSWRPWVFASEMLGLMLGNLTEESSRLAGEMEQLKESQVEAADEAANFRHDSLPSFCGSRAGTCRRRHHRGAEGNLRVVWFRCPGVRGV